MQGTIKFYNDQKGFGFIVPMSGDGDIFFHVSNVKAGYQPKQDEVVSYELGEGRDGRPVAIDVASINDNTDYADASDDAEDDAE